MLTGKIVLAVEDEESDALLLQLAAETVNISDCVLILRDGHELISYLTRQGDFADKTRYPWPGLLLLDLKMPTVDGFEVLNWLGHHPEIPRIPVVVFSASSCEADKKKAMRLGASDYLSKPSQFRVLVEIVERLYKQWLANGQAASYTQEAGPEDTKPGEELDDWLVPSSRNEAGSQSL
jgi:CheY-like chemotaxis protein